MLSKRGVSPLIATVLLIALAVALGIVVMNFGRAQIEVAAQCSVDIGLKSVMLNGKEQACLDRVSEQIFFIVENGNQIPVEGVRMRVIGDKSVFVEDLEESQIDKLGALLKYVPYDLALYGDVRELRLNPKINLYDEEVVCPEQAVVFENLRDCEN